MRVGGTGEGASPSGAVVVAALESLPPPGTRQKLLELGPKKFAEWTAKQKRLLITDTTWRDAHQSLMATRVRSYDMLACADAFAHPGSAIAVASDGRVYFVDTGGGVFSLHDGRVALAEFLSGNHLFFLNLAMAAARATTGWAMDVADSSIVTTMSPRAWLHPVRSAAPLPPFCSRNTSLKGCWRLSS